MQFYDYRPSAVDLPVIFKGQCDLNWLGCVWFFFFSLFWITIIYIMDYSEKIVCTVN